MQMNQFRNQQPEQVLDWNESTSSSLANTFERIQNESTDCL